MPAIVVPVPRNAPGIAVVGPTASGKSDLALRLAHRFGGEIVNFDSVQVYSGFDIGTAKTPPAERLSIRHHLIDHVEPDQDYSAGQFARDARRVLSDLRGRGVLPVLAGGTGLYLEAVLKGLFRDPGRSPELRERLRRTARSRPEGYLWRILEKLDPVAARAIHPHDTPKLERAIEVCVLGKRPMTEQWRDSRNPLPGYSVLQLGLEPPREELYAKINARAAQMFGEGLVDEVRSLLRRGVPRSARPFGALGYAQCLQYLDGACSLEDAVTSTSLRTRQYAKRQLTWFRRRAPEVRWVRAFGASDAASSWAQNEFRRWALDIADPLQQENVGPDRIQEISSTHSSSD